MALTVLFLHTHIDVVFFAVIGELSRFVATHSNIVVGGNGLEGHAVVGECLTIRNKANFGLTRFVAHLHVDDTFDGFLDFIHHDFGSLHHGVCMQTAHFEHHVASGVVLHFRSGSGLDRNEGVRNVG